MIPIYRKNGNSKSKKDSENKLIKSLLFKKLAVDTVNNFLRPLEGHLNQVYSFIKNLLDNIRLRFPPIYKYFERIIKQHIITPTNPFKSKRIEGIGNLITANIIRRLPHVDESSIGDMLTQSNSLSDILTKGFGLNKEEKTYTVLSNPDNGKVGFKRILIANRGEIALRIIRACRELNIESFVIYSDQEKDSLVVRFADKSYNIGDPKNYLNIKKIVNIAEKNECDALHPGYGFLAENPKLALICEKKGIKFIGPSSKIINKLGNKTEAKKTMFKLNIPVIEGANCNLKNKEDALRSALKIGFPVIIKASAGGGGKGMRIVTKEEDISDSYESAKKEALNSFGDDSVYIEKYLEEPRHIEFQILTDRYGNAVYLGERDCSIQRRYQKLIEETPSPALNDELRQIMGNAAVNAVKSLGYEGAGTVEFLLDKNKNFYFIEMNTRIQVEHGITEVVTNVDLVKEQIKLAEGAKLAYKQEDIKIEGHAIEFRINAEDPLNNFTPSPGIITNYLPPGGPGIRISSSCYRGCEILPQFDSLIALLICYGNTRQEAIARMKRSLKEFIIEGVKTTIPFHQLVLNKRQFLQGNLTTSFIENNRIMEQLKKINPKKEEISNEKKVLIVTTAVSKYIKNKQSYNNRANNKISPWLMASRQDAMSEGSFEE